MYTRLFGRRYRSGTGILSELFVRNGNPTYAVEPNAEMRSAAEADLSCYPNFHSINGTAEATTLASHSVHLVTAAQAFHWFDVERSSREFRRILKPGGSIALIWNDRKPSPFADAYDALIEKHQIDPSTTKARTNKNESNIGEFFGTGGYQVRTFDNPQIFDRRGLIDRLTSASYMPLPSDPKYAAMIEAADAIFDGHQREGVVTMTHETRVYVGGSSS